jgi:hypothetical protein
MKAAVAIIATMGVVSTQGFLVAPGSRGLAPSLARRTSAVNPVLAARSEGENERDSAVAVEPAQHSYSEKPGSNPGRDSPKSEHSSSSKHDSSSQQGFSGGAAGNPQPPKKDRHEVTSGHQDQSESPASGAGRDSRDPARDPADHEHSGTHGSSGHSTEPDKKGIESQRKFTPTQDMESRGGDVTDNASSSYDKPTN